LSGDHLTGLWRASVAPALSPRGWEELLGQARRTRLLARLALHVERQGWQAAVPPGPRLYLEGALLAAERQRRQVRWEADRIRAALAGLPGPVVLLKGAAYAAAGLPPAQGRVFSDVDVMVPREQLGLAETSLVGGGWVHQALDAYDERYYRRWMHELPPLKHVWRHTWLDLHHTITPPTSRFRVDGRQLLARVRPLQPGAALAVLAPEDMVLHSAVHLMQEGEFHTGLRDLLDLDDLLRHFGAEPPFWSALLDRAQELRLEAPLFHVLIQVRRLFGTEPPLPLRAHAQALGRGPATRVLMPALLAVALRPPHPSCDTRASGPARMALYLRSHWLRMPWWQIGAHLARKAWMRTRARLQHRQPDPAAP
jgi:hypothetical protein